MYLSAIELKLTFAGLQTFKPSVIYFSVSGTSALLKPSTTWSTTTGSAGFLKRTASWARPRMSNHWGDG